MILIAEIPQRLRRHTAEGIKKWTKVSLGLGKGVELVFRPFDGAMNVFQKLNDGVMVNEQRNNMCCGRGEKLAILRD